MMTHTERLQYIADTEVSVMHTPDLTDTQIIRLSRPAQMKRKSVYVSPQDLCLAIDCACSNHSK
jgi:hypothetical protein